MSTAPTTGREARLADEFRRTQRARRGLVVFAYVNLTIWAVISLLPIYFMFVLAFQYIGREISMLDLNWLPVQFSVDNFRNLFQVDAPWWIERRPVWRWLLNSLIVAVVPTISNLVFDAMGGYALAKLRFPGRNVLFYAVVLSMMLPEFVILIPLYRMMFNFDWINTYWALLFPGFAGVAGIFLMKQNIQTIPTSILDAARIDACSEWRIFWKIIIPLSKPILAVIGIFSFVSGWNSFFWPYLITNRSEMWTMQAGLASMMGAGATGMPPAFSDMGIVMAGSALAAIPVIIVFFLFQRYIVQGITVGAMKG